MRHFQLARIASLGLLATCGWIAACSNSSGAGPPMVDAATTADARPSTDAITVDAGTGTGAADASTDAAPCGDGVPDGVCPQGRVCTCCGPVGGPRASACVCSLPKACNGSDDCPDPDPGVLLHWPVLRARALFLPEPVAHALNHRGGADDEGGARTRIEAAVHDHGRKDSPASGHLPSEHCWRRAPDAVTGSGPQFGGVSGLGAAAARAAVVGEPRAPSSGAPDASMDDHRWCRSPR